ncbi:MAG: hypothetical protein JWO54_323 [Candidatus Saccharibacteria bacterium]|nr:hypothetical protein [Candidatus Saccharibacteria bacterium]MDB5180565.1 hypothetical protein [Candidatus Saccharibacteria bacterium]
MEKKISNSVDILKPLRKLSKRFHLTLFFVFIVACLSGAVLLINNTLKDNSSDPDYTSSINAGSIDQETLSRLNALHTSTQPSPAPALPAGRINPINE